VDGVRRRGAGARGFADGSSFANPFDDEAQALFEQELLSLHDAEVWSQDDALRQSRESTHTLSTEPLIELASTAGSNQSQYKTDDELDAEIAEAIRRSLEDVATSSVNEKGPAPAPEANVEDPPPSYLEASQMEMSQLRHHQIPDPPTSVPGSIYESFYYGPHPGLEQNLAGSSFHSVTAQPEAIASIDPMPIDEEDEHDMPTPAGTMTPTEDGFSSAASLVGSGRDVGVLSDIESLTADGEHVEQRSEAGFSETYSVVGLSTPGSWTDVESVDGEEDQGHGH
jgi:hypothetical protein